MFFYLEDLNSKFIFKKTIKFSFPRTNKYLYIH